MARKDKLIRGGFVLILAASQYGCAGSGLKNIFTRNETDGYHTLEELEAGERKIAEAANTDDETASPSLASRLTSWSPFGKQDARDKEYAAVYEDSKEADEKTKSSSVLSRAFANHDAVEPDPFLEAEFSSGKKTGPAPIKAAPNRELAKLDEKSFTPKEAAKGADEFVISPERNDSKPNNNTIAAHTVADRSTSKAATTEDDDALAKRFEQHFLLNSAGAIAKQNTESQIAATTGKLKEKAAEIAATADSRQRDVTSLAERQIDDFDYLLGGDSTGNAASSAKKKLQSTVASRETRIPTTANETSSNSLAAFDSLMGTEGDAVKHRVVEATHTVAQEAQRKLSTAEIDVADAESLFGAAAARQNARSRNSGSNESIKTASRSGDQNSAWNHVANDAEFDWKDAGNEKQVATAMPTNNDLHQAFSRHFNEASNHDTETFDDTDFGAPEAVAGNIEGDDISVVKNTDLDMNHAFRNEERQRVAGRSANGRRSVFIVPAAMESSSSASGEAQFTAAPAAPVSEQTAVEQKGTVGSRPGLIRSLSVRNWLLLIGGIIVIALLFAPGRTKPVTMTGRPANG